MPESIPAELQPIADLVNRVGNALMNQGAVVLVLIAVGIVVAGACLLLWGRHLHRAVLVIVAFPVGVTLGAMMADKFGLARWMGILAVTVSLTLLVMVLARVVWAFVAASWLAGLAASIVVYFLLGQALAGSQPEHWHPSAESLIQAAWARGDVLITASIVASGIAGLLIGIFLPRATVILITSLIGASLAALGATVLLAVGDSRLLDSLTANQPLTTGLYAAIVLPGVLYQSVREARDKRAAKAAAKEAAGAPPDTRQEPKKGKKG